MNTSYRRVSSHLCLQKDLGVNGNLFGGTLLAWIDESGAIYAREITREKFIVTYRFNEVVFKKPVKAGTMLIFTCGDIVKHDHAIEFTLFVWNDETPAEAVFSTRCVYVAVDENGQKKKIDWSKTGI